MIIEATILSGGISPADSYYCAKKPEFEIYDETLHVLRDRLFITYATRLPDLVIIEFYMVEAVE